MSSASEAVVAGVTISKPDKALYPDDGITKLDVARYYEAVAPVMLPHLRGRPVNMERFPDGLGGVTFYEKKAPAHFPEWFRRVRVDSSKGPQDQVVVDDVASLAYLAQQACLTPHTWLCRATALTKPDQLVFDLDPTVPGLPRVRRATRLVGELLDDLGLTSFLKTTGSRGYHVLVPLRPALSFDDVRAFAVACAERLIAAEPDLFTLEHRKADRGERVLVDVFRNGYAQTAVPAYSLRARPGAPVSTPIEWDELSRVAPDRFTLTSVRRRLARRDCPWADVRSHAQGLGRARKRLQGLSAR